MLSLSVRGQSQETVLPPPPLPSGQHCPKRRAAKVTRPLSTGCAGYCQVVAQGQQLSSLIFQIVDELRVFTVFPCQRLLQQKDTRTNSIFSDRGSALEHTENKERKGGHLGGGRRKLSPQQIASFQLQDPHQLSQLAVSSHTFSSNTGVSMTSAPWRLKQVMIALKTLSRMAICLGL